MVENYTYTIVPNSLRRYLKGIPSRSIPTKVDAKHLKSIGFKNSNDRGIIRVLKAVKLIDQSGVPTEDFRNFRDASRGPIILASRIREAYKGLYDTYYDAHKQSDENLRNFFRSQGDLADAAVSYQVATFKALSEFADFQTGSTATNEAEASRVQGTAISQGTTQQIPTIHIDLQIHLPDSADPAVYDQIIESIAKHIMRGRRI